MNEKRPKQSLWRLILPLLIFYGAGILAGIVFGVFFSFLTVNDLGVEGMSSLDYDKMYQLFETYSARYSQYISMVQNALVVPLALLLMNMDKKRLTAEGYYKEYEKPAIIFFLVALLLGAASSITGNNLIDISGIAVYFSDQLEAVNSAVYSGGVIVQIIAIAILAPIAEELVFRGLFFKRFRESSSATTAIIISSLVFGLMHGNVPQGIYAFLIGLVCAFAMEKFKTVLAPIIIHIGANAFSIFATNTSFIENIYNNSTTYIAYVAISAVLVVIFMWIIYDKVNPKEISK